ncbi:polysaccharide biosynthesis protein [Marivivens donghaensis]|uniref:Polysaccharide biosynthesis protein n=1 Tax=Marivivens donghaensis TaxID=1699413 RepID=A0ABX0VVA6_9RHOB|nr:nucleoside-diphosphate sugar epimerase/dehydratase [Marivivens donghaensis]NIY71380.1 polysaccharide biosynthesis protein [Marivivens donghaensis]
MFLLDLPRRAKQFLLFLLDLLLIPAALFIAVSFKHGNGQSIEFFANYPFFMPAVVIAGALAVLATALPRIKLHAIEFRAIGRIGIASLVIALATYGAETLMRISDAGQIAVATGGLFFLISIGARMVALFSLLALREHALSRVPVAIYGAGSAGIRLATAMQMSHDARPVMFVDDNPQVQGTIVHGLPVRSADALRKMISRKQVERVLIAIPSANYSRRAALVKELREQKCDVQIAPSMAELVRSKTINGMPTVSPDSLLDRDNVDLDNPRVARAYYDRVVMVTGAGGSIGSELCRQLLECGARKIVLFELSEYALYQIDQELGPLARAANVQLTTRLGSVANPRRVTQVIEDEEVEIILHAAAYKHVPLVEENEVAAAQNNVVGTRVVAEAAAAANVRRFILVSTDKAVRPSSVMGATKRMSEMVIQDMQTRSSVTKFAMVRFGNVLGSSGSVLPLFQEQISVGGPVTITHPDMRRFFMTIPEAARLVLLAGAFAEGDDIFVLDMGEPVYIMDIAKRLIKLTGHRVYDGRNENDIKIEIVGTRPGEKLVEELVIDPARLISTQHEKILRAHEDRPSPRLVTNALRMLTDAINESDSAAVRAALAEALPGFGRALPDNVVPFGPAQATKR